MRARPGADAFVVVIVATVVLVALAFTVGAFADASAAENAEAGAATTSGTTTTATTTTATTTSGTTATDDGPPESARLVARYPAANGSMVERTLLAPAGVARVEPPVNDSRTEGWRVGLTLTPSAADRFASVLVDAGFTEDDAPGCPTTDSRNDEGYCVLVLVDGDPVSAFELGPRFAAAVESGAFADDPRFVLALADHDDARDVWRGFLESERDATTAPSSTTTAGTATTTTTAGTAPTSAVDATASRTTSTGAIGKNATATATESSPTPGFGGVAVLAAALLLAVLAVARRDDD